jgi:pyridoxine 4-dehydrogenase
LQGLVQAVGVSNYGPKQMQKIAKYLSKRGVPLVTAQVMLPLCHRFGPDIHLTFPPTAATC